MKPIIEVANVRKGFATAFSLSIPRLCLSRGTIVGLVGNNGAGKTTLLKLILDLILPDSGEVLINGENVRLTESWKFSTSSYLDESYLMDYMTPGEYVHFITGLKEIRAKETLAKVEEFAAFLSPKVFLEQKLIRNYSKGNIQKIGIVSSLVLNAQTIVLDEPFSDLDPSARYSLIDILRKQKQQGTTILLSSHDIETVHTLCDRVILLDNGKVLSDTEKGEETKAKLQSHFKVNSQYE